MAEIIPDRWKDAVKTILSDAPNDCIRVTKRAFEDFQIMFPLSFSYNLFRHLNRHWKLPV